MEVRRKPTRKSRSSPRFSRASLALVVVPVVAVAVAEELRLLLADETRREGKAAKKRAVCETFTLNTDVAEAENYLVLIIAIFFLFFCLPRETSLKFQYRSVCYLNTSLAISTSFYAKPSSFAMLYTCIYRVIARFLVRASHYSKLNHRATDTLVVGA